MDSLEIDPFSPKSIDEIVGNRETWSNLAKKIQEQNSPHFILSGPSGVGKSLFLKFALKNHTTLFHNCVSDSGLRDVRDFIRTFARGSRDSEGKFRWIVLEHADSLTADTQAFLRRMLETTSSSNRIVFEVRDIGAISEPIVSRTQIIHVANPDPTEIFYEVNRRTGFSLPKKIIETIVKESRGNVRYAVKNGLAQKNVKLTTKEHFGNGSELFQYLNDTRPEKNTPQWTQWLCFVEKELRRTGSDMREFMMTFDDPKVSYSFAQWARLGGSSGRALFFHSLSS